MARSLSDETVESFVDVLNAIRLGGARSRAEVRHQRGLGRAVVAQRISELVACGLVREDGPGLSTGGRRPRQLAFEAGAGDVLVADLGATSIDVALTDLAGHVHAHLAEEADISAGPTAVLERVDQLFTRLIDSADHWAGRPWGIGIGVPGPVEFRTGRPASPPIMPGWDGFPIRQRFAERFDAPTWIDNDVNVMALGEWRRGIAQGHTNVIFVKVGTGIGAGLISDGVLHRGDKGAAGDVGHIQIVDDRRVVCRCGNIGCLEALAGGAALGHHGEAAAQDGRSLLLAKVRADKGVVSAADVGWAAGQGDPVSIEVLQEAGREIGLMLASIVNFFNPSLIVIGGGVANSGDHLLASIRQRVYGRSLPLATRELSIKMSSLGPRAGVTGAAAMVVDQLFSIDCLRRWIDHGSPAGHPEVVEDLA